MTALSAGVRLGPYQILGPIGAGGMGEVYRASDTRLDRVVAIKVLPPHWAADSEMRQRFEREAQALASLSHPHICVLHDIGKQDGADFLVMEFLEGETMATRLERGALGLSEALRLGLEIADSLDKAHRKGVVHRDLKPSNVMLTKSGTKLVDFGLAKFAKVGTFNASNTNSPTAMPTGKDLTTPGTILGTLQYMAPEQLEGLEADERTDIFAFGVLLYEMVSGKRAFEGKSRVLLISAIATSDPPPLSSVEPGATRALDHVVKICLAKEPADRWQTARDLLAELEFAAEGDTELSAAASIPTSTRGRVWLNRLALAAAGLAAGAAVASAAAYIRGPAVSDELRFRVPIQLSAQTAVAGGRGNASGAAQGFQGVSGPAVFNPANFAISPDGRNLAFVARQSNQQGADNTWYLYFRPVGAVTPQRLQGTEGAAQPFWSADGKSIGFVSAGKLKRIEASGGPPQEISSDVGNFNGGTWNSDGIILFGSAQGLQRVPAQGGKPEVLAKPSQSETGLFWPQFLPDGHHYVYTAWSAQAANRAILGGSIDSPEMRVKILAVASNAGYAAAGYLVFHRDEAVYAQTFDPGNLSVSGNPERIANEISYDGGTGRGDFSVAPTGALAYFYSSGNAGTPSGSQTDLSEWQFTWVNRATGQGTEPVGPPGVYRGVNLSPDTTRVAVHRHDANGGDIVVFEPRGSQTRLTLDASQHNSMPVWSYDGSRIVFASLRNGKWGLYQTLSTRSGTQELLYESDLPDAPMSWSQDGKYLVFWVQDPKNAGDIWVYTFEDKKASKLIATAFNETHPQISPDGKWIAYTDNSKENKNEIYMQPFPSLADRYQISTDGGDWPRWRGDSKELFYQSIGNPGTPGVSLGATAYPALLYSASIDVKGLELQPGAPRQVTIFPVLNMPHTGGSYYSYAVDPTGQRILAAQFVSGSSASPGTQIGPDTLSGLTVALNWTSTLKK